MYLTKSVVTINEYVFDTKSKMCQHVKDVHNPNEPLFSRWTVHDVTKSQLKDPVAK